MKYWIVTCLIAAGCTALGVVATATAKGKGQLFSPMNLSRRRIGRRDRMHRRLRRAARRTR